MSASLENLTYQHLIKHILLYAFENITININYLIWYNSLVEHICFYFILITSLI